MMFRDRQLQGWLIWKHYHLSEDAMSFQHFLSILSVLDFLNGQHVLLFIIRNPDSLRDPVLHNHIFLFLFLFMGRLFSQTSLPPWVLFLPIYYNKTSCLNQSPCDLTSMTTKDNSLPRAGTALCALVDWYLNENSEKAAVVLAEDSLQIAFLHLSAFFILCSFQFYLLLLPPYFK